ncbi:MAG TPA: hypothetical protein VNY83_04495 [Solirubrobacterales bacterium]|jgi:hypothetical protein|nr:hypothetical protein [Solirubrobacterales bacterium]
MARKLAVSIPRIALTPAEAAAAIGVGPDFFDVNVAPELRLIRRGRKRLVPVTELERWVTESAGTPIAEEIGRQSPGVPMLSSTSKGSVARNAKADPLARQRRRRA